MTIGVFCPLFNSLKYLDDLISSLNNQSNSDFKVYFIDDDSSDDTLEIITHKLNLASIKFEYEILGNPKNLGYLKTINKLWKLSTEDYIAFHDSDDYWHPNFIKSIVCNFGVDFICFNFKRFLLTDEIGSLNTEKKISSIEVYTNQKIVGSGLAFKRCIFPFTNLFLENFNKSGGEDLYFFNYLRSNYRGIFIRNVFYFYRYNSNSITLAHNFIQGKLISLYLNKITSNTINYKVPFFVEMVNSKLFSICLKPLNVFFDKLRLIYRNFYFK